MGGRGASSGKGKSGLSGSKTPALSKPTISSTPLKKMTNAALKKELLKLTTYYYKSGKSGISFGNRSPEEAAKMLVGQKRSRSSMEKDYRALLKRIK